MRCGGKCNVAHGVLDGDDGDGCEDGDISDFHTDVILADSVTHGRR